MELTPRTGPEAGEATGADGRPAPVRKSWRNRLPALALLTIVLVVGGFVMVNALGSATTFYRNVDEAVAQRDSLGTTRFRMQGTVVPGTVEQTGEGVTFMVAFNGVEVPVEHRGDPPEMFKPSEAVLLEGHFADDGSDTFDSDLMIVKHSEQYTAKEGDRLKEAQDGGAVPVSTTAGADGS